MTIHTERVEIAVAGKPMTGYLAAPDTPGPHPAVLVIEEIFGLNAFIREVVERVAKEGYVALAPDIHHRDLPAGKEIAYGEAGMKEGMTLIPKLAFDNIKADLDASLAFLRARKDVVGDRVGCMGFCIGGHVAYIAACATDVKATASFYGGGIASFGPGGGPPTVERSAGIKGRILCLFGGKDPMIPQAQVDKIHDTLKANHIKHEVVVYPEASHAFFCDSTVRGSFVPAAAEDAWVRVKKLFAEELRA
jgi:carboxymethylenebutenolidase